MRPSAHAVASARPIMVGVFGLLANDVRQRALRKLAWVSPVMRAFCRSCRNCRRRRKRRAVQSDLIRRKSLRTAWRQQRGAGLPAGKADWPFSARIPARWRWRDPKTDPILAGRLRQTPRCRPDFKPSRIPPTHHQGLARPGRCQNVKFLSAHSDGRTLAKAHLRKPERPHRASLRDGPGRVRRTDPP